MPGPEAYNPEELTRITHNRLRRLSEAAKINLEEPGETPIVSGCKPEIIPKDQIPKMTQQNLKSLKTTVDTKTASRAPMDLFGRLFGMFRKKKPCELEGHVLPSGGWSGTEPVCEECNQNIKPSDNIRCGTSPKKAAT